MVSDGDGTASTGSFLPKVWQKPDFQPSLVAYFQGSKPQEEKLKLRLV